MFLDGIEIKLPEMYNKYFEYIKANFFISPEDYIKKVLERESYDFPERKDYKRMPLEFDQ